MNSQRLNHFVLLLILTSILAAFIFPDIVIFHQAQFTRFADYSAGYYGSFTLINFLTHGVQLWDVFDQVPMAFHVMTIGIFNIINLSVAVIFLLLSVFTKSPAVLFHDVFSVVFIIGSIYLKVVGCFLLFGRFIKHPSALIVAALAGGFCYNQQFIATGLNYGMYVPLLIHLTLRVIESPGGKTIARWILAMAICFLHSALHGAYLYAGLHFFILACVIQYGFSRRPWQAFSQGWDIKSKGMLVVAAAIVMVVGCYYVTFWKDLDFGLSDRLNQLTIGSGYFLKKFVFHPNKEFFANSINIHDGHSWPFLGYAVVMLGVFGVVFSLYRYKYCLMLAIVVAWLLNSLPTDSWISYVTHGINAWTNPMSFLINNFQEYQTCFIPIWFLCLALLGLVALSEWRKTYTHTKMMIFMTIMLTYLLGVFGQIDGANQWYLGIQTLLLIGMGIVYYKQSMKRWRVLVLAIFLVIEFAVCLGVARQSINTPLRPVPIDSSLGKKIAGVEFQNPLIFPWRYTYDLALPTQDLQLRLGYINGLFLRYYAFGQHLKGASEVFPRHIAFREWEKIDIAKYLSNYYPIFMVTDRENHLFRPTFRFIKFSSSFFEPVRLDNEVMTVQLSLYDNINPFFSSTLFGFDFDCLQAFLMQDKQQATLQQLQPAQGWLIAPNSFDVSNVRTNYLTFKVKQEDYPIDKQLVLGVLDLKSIGFVSIKEWSNDVFHVLMDNNNLGKLRVHYPYDPKWVVTIDGKVTSSFKTDYGFFYINLPQGKHEIKIAYLPYFPLRWIVLPVFLMAIGCLIYIIYREWRDRHYHD